MTSHNDTKLDNPVWHSLNETHSAYCLEFDGLKCYRPDHAPFVAFPGNAGNDDALQAYSGLADEFFVVGDKPGFPADLELKKELVCFQMIARNRVSVDTKDPVMPLTGQFRQQTYDLINRVQPGYFRKQTWELGDYFGIVLDEQLVAVTGERMKMNEAIEVSAVVTHPGFARKGFAAQLVAHTINRIIEQGKLPFLHVAETNTAAIRLYQKLGFTFRRKISFWKLGRI